MQFQSVLGFLAVALFSTQAQACVNLGDSCVGTAIGTTACECNGGTLVREKGIAIRDLY
jgi:hypothetical protein